MLPQFQNSKASIFGNRVYWIKQDCSAPFHVSRESSARTGDQGTPCRSDWTRPTPLWLEPHSRTGTFICFCLWLVTGLNFYCFNFLSINRPLFKIIREGEVRFLIVHLYALPACASALHTRKGLWDAVNFSHRREAGLACTTLCFPTYSLDLVWTDS